MWKSIMTGLRMAPNFSKFGVRMFNSAPKATPKPKIGMKELVRDYGWAATGVYAALCLIDLPLSYLLVHSAGQDRLESWESKARGLLGVNAEMENTYVRKATSGGKSLFWAEFGIAYIIHKSLIFIRVPLTVALTPKIANKLGQWGFNIKRAVPSVDKVKMNDHLATKIAESNSKTVKKAADLLNHNVKPASREQISKARQVLADFKSEIEKGHKR